MRLFTKRRIVATLSAVLMIAVALLATAAYAATGPTGIRATYLVDGRPVQGVGFRFYRVMDWTRRGELFWLEPYSDYRLGIDMSDEAKVGNLAQTLAGHISNDGLRADASGVTDGDGAVSVDGLKAGVYLMVGDAHSSGRSRYSVVPVFVTVLDGRVEDVSVKYSVYVVPPVPETVTLKVLKIWDDVDTGRRPASVTVSLLRDGKAYDTVVLTERGSWRHTWTGLDAGHDWSVVEIDCPEGYTVEMSRAGTTFMVTNRAVPEEPWDPGPTPTPSNPVESDPIETPGVTETPGPSDPVSSDPVESGPVGTPEPSDPVSSDPVGTPEVTETPGPTPDPSPTPSQEIIIQTGHIMWPWASLAGLGFIFVIVGLCCRKSDDDEE